MFVKDLIMDCCVYRCLWPATDSMRTDWLLGLDKASLRLVIGFITGHCEIKSLTIAVYVATRESWRLSSTSTVTAQP